MTDQEGLFDADPRRSESAVLMQEVIAGDPSLKNWQVREVLKGRGGMLPKIHAAEKAARSGQTHSLFPGNGQTSF
ncbi:MAG: hypothetical protein CM1200mP41_29000 [Gammaproteobacteria bacterium]|nr:MAG: hypothetical protein CM1200mP41_29000 [Gammaproteobacteria bacterium]